MNTSVDKALGVLVSAVIIYCLHLPIFQLFALLGFNGIAFLFLFPFIPTFVGVVIYLVLFPISLLIVVVGISGKLRRKEQLTRWDNLRLLGAGIITFWGVIWLFSSLSGTM